MHLAITTGLPTRGITMCISSEVRDRLSGCGGVGVISLYHFIGTSGALFLLEQIFRNTILGKMINTCIKDIMLDSGLDGLLWSILSIK